MSPRDRLIEPASTPVATLDPLAGVAGTLLNAMASGLIAGLVAVVMALSLAALVFSGPLAGSIGIGVVLALLATAVNTAVVARLATLPGTVGGSQSLPVAILATSSAGLAAHLTTSGASQAEPALVSTVVAAFGLSTAATGVALLVLGRLRAGSLVRFIPYPVLGGVLAGSGWLLAQGALGVLAPMAAPGAAATATVMAGSLSALSTWQGGAALGWAVLMLLVHRRWPHPLSMLAMVALGIVAFHAVARLLGHSQQALTAAGWLMSVAGPVDGSHVWSTLQPAAVQWQALFEVAGDLAMVPVVSAVALLLNAAALEAAVRRPVNLDRELLAAGCANVTGGLLGGLPGYQQLGLSVMNVRSGATSRWVGLWAAVPCVGALAMGSQLLQYLPRALLGALLLFMALLMVHDWVATSWGRLSRLDHLVVLLIVGVTATLGMLPAVLVGLLAALSMFAFHYARIDVVRQALSGLERRSRVGWSIAQRARLHALGAATQILQLQGYLFFGIADRLLRRAQGWLAGGAGPPPRYLVLDCRHVTGVDSSAAQSFARLHQQLDARGVHLVVTQPSPAVRAQLHAAGLSPALGTCSFFDSLDQGLEWCERQLLADVPAAQALHDPDLSLHQQLARALGSAAEADELLARLPRMSLQPGEVLIARQSSGSQLYLMESGAVCAQRSEPGRPPVRLQVTTGATVLGEVAFYLGLPRTADVLAMEPTVVYRLAPEVLQAIQAERPMLAAGLHRWVAQVLASRVAHLVGVVQALE